MSALHRLRQRARDLPVEGPVGSPCVSICRMDAARATCEGCLRTLDEIARWGTMADAERRRVWALVGQRAQAQLDAAGTT